ncbi:transcriptional regulatory protein [Mycolicibacterium flavescens]|nr:transcriptional regulatory protein [Mycolicibacterium flavescens]
MRAALRRLWEDKLVRPAPERGMWTVVRQPDTHSPDTRTIDGIDALSGGYRRELDSVELVIIDAELSEWTGLRTGQEWLCVRAFYMTQGQESPTSRMESYVNRSFAAIRSRLEYGASSICSLIEDFYQVSIFEIREEITAILTPPDLREQAKNVPSGMPALKKHRTYLTPDGEIAQVTIDTYRAPNFRHSMTIRR